LIIIYLTLTNNIPTFLPARLWRENVGMLRVANLSDRIVLTFFLEFAFFVRAFDFAFGGEDEEGFTIRADFAVGLVPEGEVAFRISIAAVKRPAAFGFPLHDVADITLGTSYAGFLFNFFNAFTGWII
jgi:hypothetical protein